MSSAIVLPAKFNVSLCSLSEIKQNKYTKSNSAYLNYNGGMSLTLQTPSLSCPFGLNVDEKGKQSVTLALRGYEENPKVKAFYTALSSLDNWMLDQAVKNSRQWFKSDMSKEVLKHMYTPCAKFGKDKDGNQSPYPPNIKLNFKKARDSDEIDCAFHDEHSKPIKGVPLEEMLVKKSEVTCLIQCTGVWFAAGKFGLSWKAVLVRLDRVPMGSGGMGLLDDDGEPISSSNAAGGSGGGSAFAEPAEFSSRPAKKAPVAVEDSEEEEEEEHAPAPVVSTNKPTMAQVVAASTAVESESEEEEHAPAPVPKKTVVTKKKIVAASTKK